MKGGGLRLVQSISIHHDRKLDIIIIILMRPGFLYRFTGEHV